MRQDFLPFCTPSIGPEEVQEVVDTLQSNWLTTGPKTKRFEADFAHYTQAPATLGLSSCTAGLHLALLCSGIGPGDEVITTPMTFAATANVIEHVGAKLVLADVEPDTLNVCPQQIERAVTPRTKAVIAVHYAGHPADLAALRAITDANGLTLIEDAAHAIGAAYQGQPIGGHGNPTSFSFYATKNLTTAEGGMLCGASELIEQARVLSLHGLSRDAWRRYQQAGGWRYAVEAPGFKYNMTDLQASLGIHQLRRFAASQERRQEIVTAYNRDFAPFQELELPVVRGDVDHAWHLYVLRIRPSELTIGRDEFLQQLNASNIGTSVHFVPIHTHPYYQDKYGYQPDDFPTAFSNFERMISLPLHPGLSDDDVGDVVEAVTTIVRRHRRRLAA